MEYTLRKLTSADIFPLTKILSEIGIKNIKSAFDSDEIKTLLSGANKNVEALGMTVIFNVGGIIIENLSACENDLYKFLASVAGVSVNTLKNCSLAEFAELIIAIVTKEEFKDFFGVVSKLLN